MDVDLEPGLRARYDRMRAIVRGLGSAAVAFSGGVDSALVLKVCRDELGGRAVAVTARSASFPPEEMADAVRIASEIGARQLFVDTEEIALRGYAENGTERCFACKSELFRKIAALARREGLAAIADGLNLDDAGLGDERPGTRAGEARGVVSPLREAGLGKDGVRALARALGLSAADKPAMACLSSRIPFGERITEEKLAAVAAAEGALRRLGFEGARVRHHGAVARIEVPAGRLREALEPGVREAIVEGVRGAGFTYVALDLEGYRAGSMHEALRRAALPMLGVLPLAPLMLAALLAGGGCVESVKASHSRVLTAEQLAQVEAERKREKSDAPAPARQPPPATPQEEIARFLRLAEEQPGRPEWQFKLGFAYEKQGLLEPAEARYRKGIELIPDRDRYTGPHLFLGRVLAKQSKDYQALAELRRAVAVKPPDVEGYYLNPDYRDAHFLLGAIQHKLKDMSASQDSFRLYLKYGGDRDEVARFFPKMIAE